MKTYWHISPADAGHGAEPLTVILRCEGTTSVAEAAQRAISRANAKNGASLSFGSIKVRAEGGSGAAKLDAALEDVIPDKGDLFLQCGPDSSGSAASPPTATASPSAGQPPSVHKLVSEWVTKAESALDRGVVAGALAAFERVLEAVPGTAAAKLGRARCLAAAKRHKEALGAFKQYIADHGPGAEALAAREAARCAVELERGEDAVSLASSAVRALAGQPPSRSAAGALPPVSASPSAAEADAWTLFAQGAVLRGTAQQAADTLLPLLQRNSSLPEASATYARLMWAVGERESAVRLAVRALVLNTDNRTIRRCVGEIAGQEEGRRLNLAVLSESDDASGTAQAAAFLGGVVKEYSAIDTALALYRLARELAPGNASYALNEAHLFELRHDYARAASCALAFYAANPGQQVGAVRCGDVAAAVGGDSVVARVADLAGEAGPGRSLPHWRPGSTAAPQPASVSDGDARSPLDAPAVVAWRASAEAAQAGKEDGGGGARGAVQDADLDLLALHKALAKILFIVGHTEALPPLVRLLEPLRRSRPLHKTSIRNENAYFICVEQLLALPAAVPGPDAAPITTSTPTSHQLWVFGDSHCLPPAWRVVDVQGARVLLRPVLATGVKVWHLRESSTFYPKLDFLQGARTLPQGAAALFLFGEIDCREGIVRAVERGYYPDAKEAARSVAKIYVRTLEEVSEKRGIRVIVHPVLPVLDITRSNVLTFNAALRRAVEASPRLTWLPCDEDLLDDAGMLRAEYKLDGTHIHPSYLQSVATCLARMS